MGVARLGNLIEYIPYPVTTGFTTGIATVIAALQIKDALGLQTGPLPEHFFDEARRVLARARRPRTCASSRSRSSTFALLRLLPQVTRKVPAPLLAIAGVTAAVAVDRGVSCPASASRRSAPVSTRSVNGVEVAGIPSVFPRPSLPWGDDAAQLRPAPRAVPGGVRDRDAGRDRIAAVRGHRRRHDRHEARSRTPSWSRSGSATSSRRSSAASPRPARSRAPRRTSVPARARRSPP